MRKPVEVECYAGYQADQEPRAFVLEGQRHKIVTIVDRWREPDADFFRVRTGDGELYLLQHDGATDAWFVVTRRPRSATDG